MTQGSYRRVVTGLDAAGRSCVIVDGPVVPVGDALGVAWRTAAVPADNSGTQDAGQGSFDMDQMQAGGTFFLVCEHPPHSDGFWHATDTLDYIVILEGEVVLMVDTGEVRLGPGDLVVDRGIRHRWRNDSDAVCKSVIVTLPSLPVGAGRTV